MQNLVYLALNQPYIAKEVILSIKSLNEIASPDFMDETNIIIYTNFPDEFKEISKHTKNIKVKIISDQQLKIMLGADNYIYRIRACSY